MRPAAAAILGAAAHALGLAGMALELCSDALLDLGAQLARRDR